MKHMNFKSRLPAGRWKWRFAIEWKYQDLWIGAFWKTDKLGGFDLWICLIPCVPLHWWTYWSIDLEEQL